MKKFLLILAAVLFQVTLHAQQPTNLVATVRGVLVWDDSNAPEIIAGYNLRFTGPTNAMTFTTLKTHPVTNTLAPWPNGFYRITVSALSKSEVESAESDPLTFFWYGQLVRITNIQTQFFRVKDF